MASKKKSRKRRMGNVDPEYLKRYAGSLKRTCRKTVLFNKQELAAIDEYCRANRIASRSALIREAVMTRVLEDVEDRQPTLF